MNWFTYLHRTPLAQIRADWSEYMGLWRKCAMLRGLRNAEYNKIVAIVNGETMNVPAQSCVLQTYYYTNSTPAHNGNDGLDNMMWIAQTTCENFHDGGVKCEKSDCPFAARNHKYADACERFSLMRQARRDFWPVKFAQAAQHTK